MRFYDTIRKVDPITRNTTYERVLKGEGNFIQYSQNHLEYENGAGMYPVAIIETPDGKVHSISIDYVEFVVDKEPYITFGNNCDGTACPKEGGTHYSDCPHFIKEKE